MSDETEANRQTIRAAFEAWRDGTRPITDVFAPTMTWRIEGHSAASREYGSTQEFVDEVLAPFGARWFMRLEQGKVVDGTAFYDSISFNDLWSRVQAELAQLRSDMTELMTAAVEAGSEAVDETAAYVVSGETNLLEVEDLASNMARLRELFKLFEQKTGLMQLLDVSNRAEGVQLFIGGESGLEPLDSCSVVAAPYEVNGVVVGSALVDQIAKAQTPEQAVDGVLSLCKTLAEGVRSARA